MSEIGYKKTWLLVLLFALIAHVGAWGACIDGSIPSVCSQSCITGSGAYEGCPYSYWGKVNCSAGKGDIVVQNGRTCYITKDAGCYNANVYFCSQMHNIVVPQGFCCDTPCEADSIKCVREDGTWTSGQNGQCGKCNQCTQNDTS